MAHRLGKYAQFSGVQVLPRSGGRLLKVSFFMKCVHTRNNLFYFTGKSLPFLWRHRRPERWKKAYSPFLKKVVWSHESSRVTTAAATRGWQNFSRRREFFTDALEERTKVWFFCDAVWTHHNFYFLACFAESSILWIKRALFQMMRTKKSANWLHFLPKVVKNLVMHANKQLLRYFYNVTFFQNALPKSSLGGHSSAEITSREDDVRVRGWKREAGVLERVERVEDWQEAQKAYERKKNAIQKGDFVLVRLRTRGDAFPKVTSLQVISGKNLRKTFSGNGLAEIFILRKTAESLLFIWNFILVPSQQFDLFYSDLLYYVWIGWTLGRSQPCTT